MIKLIIIDFDDTLCLTEEACFRMENEIAGTMGYDPMTREAHKKNWGRPVQQAIVERFPGIDVGKFMQIFAETMPKYISSEQLDVVKDKDYLAVDQLIEQGKKVAILTSRIEVELKHILENPEHPLRKRFEDIQYQGNSEYLKPDPRVFDALLKKYQVKPEEAVYIGDTVSDAVCSRAAGVWFIASLESGLRTRADFTTSNVNFFVNDFADVPKIITQIDKMEDVQAHHYNAATTDKQSELLCEVDEQDNLIGSITRFECHNETRKPWHRSTHIYLFDKSGKIYFTRRSLKKDTAPGLWTVSAGGHVKFGSDYLETANAELKEELDLEVELEMIDKLTIDYGSEREIIAIFAGVTGQKPRINPEEVAEITAFSYQEVSEKIEHGEFALSGGSRDSFAHLLKTGTLLSYKNRKFNI